MISLAEGAQEKGNAPSVAALVNETARIYSASITSYLARKAAKHAETARTFEDLRPEQAQALTEGLFAKLNIKVEQ